MYDWVESFYSQQALQSKHILRFTCEKLWLVVVRDTVDSPEREINLLIDKKWHTLVHSLPEVTPPLGPSLERKHYLPREDQRVFGLPAIYE